MFAYITTFYFIFLYLPLAQQTSYVVAQQKRFDTKIHILYQNQLPFAVFKSQALITGWQNRKHVQKNVKGMMMALRWYKQLQIYIFFY